MIMNVNQTATHFQLNLGQAQFKKAKMELETNPKSEILDLITVSYVL